MLKLILGRLLPAGMAVGLFTSALSPLRPAIDAFGTAANALAGESNAGGQALPDQLNVPVPQGIGIAGFFSSLFAPAQQQDNARRQIDGLVEKLKEKNDRAAALVPQFGAEKPKKKKKTAKK